MPFTVDLRDTGGGLAGEVSEPAPAYLPPGDMVAIITGKREGSRVTFTKIYDSLEHFLDPVTYDGTIDEEECEIAGEWTISPDWSGTFLMTRPKPEEAAAEAEEEAELER